MTDRSKIKNTTIIAQFYQKFSHIVTDKREESIKRVKNQNIGTAVSFDRD
jgi:hypothetical protein